jgi:hypothetical protein
MTKRLLFSGSDGGIIVLWSMQRAVGYGDNQRTD